MTVLWAGAPNPTSTDWIGLFEVGAPNQTYKAFLYTHGKAIGDLAFTIPVNLPRGRTTPLLPNDGYVRTTASAR